jgi:3-hydroxyacyl-[acyl-carrier-protein] dehydratase
MLGSEWYLGGLRKQAEKAALFGRNGNQQRPHSSLPTVSVAGPGREKGGVTGSQREHAAGRLGRVWRSTRVWLPFLSLSRRYPPLSAVQERPCRFVSPLLRAPMRFSLIDRVLAIEPGKSITASKGVSLSEEYLADHFPCFPVLPGVLMLEGLTQAAAWTIRLGEDFAHSVVVLREASNVKYGDFAQPGSLLTVTAEVLSQDEKYTKVKASGLVEGRPSLKARLVLERYNLAPRVPYGEAIDARVRAKMRHLWTLLAPPSRGWKRQEPVPAGFVSRANGHSPVQVGTCSSE